MSMWGGRFGPDAGGEVWGFTTDPGDRRLLGDDIVGSIAHVRALGSAEILDAADVDAILAGLDQIRDEERAGAFLFLETDEDVHSAVERRLGEVVGEVAGKLHTGRSRNDQVALDVRLYLARAVEERTAALSSLVSTLVDLAERNVDTVVPFYTHLQQAQVVSLGHHFLAHGWAILRSGDRLKDALGRISVSPLGAGAGGGSTLPLNPAAAADELGFRDVFANSLDAVGARDHIAEYCFAAAQALIDLSRLGEELVLWATTEFGWVTFGDEVTTGSSALPHKKNPDVAELIRGRAAGGIGAVAAILALQKGLPLAYNRDLQEDKRHLFFVDDALSSSISAMEILLRHAEFHPPPPSSFTTALDLAEVLVRRGVPFREAHEAVGRVVAAVISRNEELTGATASDLASAHPRFDSIDLDLIDPEISMERRITAGGGGRASVIAQIAAIRSRLDRPAS